MNVPKVTIITCFSYRGNQKYVFNPQHLRSDLRRIILFSHNRIGCSLENTYILTDLVPSAQIQTEIIEDFQEEVDKYLREVNLIPAWTQLPTCSHTQNPLNWLKSICTQISSQHADFIYHDVINRISPTIRNSNIVEFVSLFTNYILISGVNHFERTLKSISPTLHGRLFFYYTGHGIRRHDGEIALVIPGPDYSAEYYTKQQVQKCFHSILSSVHSAFIVFDCCYGESLLELPHKVTFNPTRNRSQTYPNKKYKSSPVIYLSSTWSDQTCGFNSDGSLFTFYLIRFLENGHRDLTRLYLAVEKQIQQYRKSVGKPAQNMVIGLSDDSITELPSWLFNKSTPRFYLIGDTD